MRTYFILILSRDEANPLITLLVDRSVDQSVCKSVIRSVGPFAVTKSDIYRVRALFNQIETSSIIEIEQHHQETTFKFER